jgi:hypothetical protein
MDSKRLVVKQVLFSPGDQIQFGLTSQLYPNQKTLFSFEWHNQQSSYKNTILKHFYGFDLEDEDNVILPTEVDTWGRMKSISKKKLFSYQDKQITFKRDSGKLALSLGSLEKGEFQEMLLADIRQLYTNEHLVTSLNENIKQICEDLLHLELQNYTSFISKVVSNSYLQSSTSLKKKAVKAKSSSKIESFYNHSFFKKVFLHPFQKQFIQKFLNFFDKYLDDFSNRKNSYKEEPKAAVDSPMSLQEILQIGNSFTTETSVWNSNTLQEIQKYVSTLLYIHQDKVYKRVVSKMKEQRKPFEKFYSQETKPQKISLEKALKQNILRYEGSNTESLNEILSKNILSVFCQNESIFDKKKNVLPISINGVIEKRIKQELKGVTKKVFEEFNFFQYGEEFLILKIDMKDFISRVLFFFRDFVLDYQQFYFDSKFISEIGGSDSQWNKLFIDELRMTLESQKRTSPVQDLIQKMTCEQLDLVFNASFRIDYEVLQKVFNKISLKPSKRKKSYKASSCKVSDLADNVYKRYEQFFNSKEKSLTQFMSDTTNKKYKSRRED